MFDVYAHRSFVDDRWCWLIGWLAGSDSDGRWAKYHFSEIFALIRTEICALVTRNNPLSNILAYSRYFPASRPQHSQQQTSPLTLLIVAEE